MEAWKQIRAPVRAMRTEKSTISASCARTDAPPINGGRGLKPDQQGGGENPYLDAPPINGGRGLKLRCFACHSQLPTDAPPINGGRGLKRGR